MKKFFTAKSIAVIGASHKPEKIGYIIFKNLLEKFKGKAFPVNVKTEPILGRKVYPTVKAIKEKIDLAIVAVPAPVVPSVVEDCGKKGIKRIVIISGGFSEIGEKGKELSLKLLQLKKKYKLRIIGPNVIGIYSPENGLDAIFFSDSDIQKPKDGNVAILSQSGTVGALILDGLAKENVGVSKAVSYGNALDVNESDLIEFFGKDKKTKVIAGFIEGVRNGKKFISVAKKISKKKSIVLLKGGKTSLGSRAASSHTASLAGDYKVYAGVFKQTGIIEAKTWEELFDFTKALSKQKRFRGKRVCIVTNGGGFGVLSTDALASLGFDLPEPSKKLKEKLSKVLPPYASLKNPIDLTGDADPERWEKALKILSKSKEYDAFLVILLMQTPMMNERIVNALKAVKQSLTVCMTGSGTEKIKNELEKIGIPVYPSPERAAKALKALKI